MQRFVFYLIMPIVLMITSTEAQVNGVTPSAVAVHGFNQKDMMTQAILQLLAEKYHFVIGVYGTIVGRDRLKTIDIQIADGTLADAFDAVTKADARFAWHEDRNGAVHFVTWRSPLSLMDVTLPSFDDENPREETTSDRLFEVPEIRAWLQTHKCVREHTIQVTGRPPVPWSKFVFDATGLPFSAVMDEIAAKSRTYYWDAVQYSSEPCRVDISWGDVQP